MGIVLKLSPIYSRVPRSLLGFPPRQSLAILQYYGSKQSNPLGRISRLRTEPTTLHYMEYPRTFTVFPAQFVICGLLKILFLLVRSEPSGAFAKKIKVEVRTFTDLKKLCSPNLQAVVVLYKNGRWR